MILIGVTGYRRSGKNTTTQILAREFGFTQYAFADPLRTMAVAINPMIDIREAPVEIVTALRKHAHFRYGHAFRYNDLLELLSYEFAKGIPDLRRFLQHLGTDGVRGTFGPQAWVDALDRKVREANVERVTVSDVRFASEAEWIHNNGGILWRVVRPGIGGDDSHASEVEIPFLPADRELVNTSLDLFERAVIDAALADLSTLAHPLPKEPCDKQSNFRGQ